MPQCLGPRLGKLKLGVKWKAGVGWGWNHLEASSCTCWRLGWHELDYGLSGDSWSECLYEVSLHGLGFLTVWRPLGSLTSYKVAQCSRSWCPSKQGGSCIAFHDLALEVTSTNVHWLKWSQACTDSKGADILSTSQWEEYQRICGHVLKSP